MKNQTRLVFSLTNLTAAAKAFLPAVAIVAIGVCSSSAQVTLPYTETWADQTVGQPLDTSGGWDIDYGDTEIVDLGSGSKGVTLGGQGATTLIRLDDGLTTTSSGISIEITLRLNTTVTTGNSVGIYISESLTDSTSSSYRLEVWGDTVILRARNGATLNGGTDAIYFTNAAGWQNTFVTYRLEVTFGETENILELFINDVSVGTVTGSTADLDFESSTSGTYEMGLGYFNFNKDRSATVGDLDVTAIPEPSHAALGLLTVSLISLIFFRLRATRR